MPPGHCSLGQRGHVAGPELQRRALLDLDPRGAFEHKEDLRLRQHPWWRFSIGVRREAAQPGSHGARVDEHMLLGTASNLRVRLPLLRRDVGNETPRWTCIAVTPSLHSVKRAARPADPSAAHHLRARFSNHPPLSLALSLRAKNDDERTPSMQRRSLAPSAASRDEQQRRLVRLPLQSDSDVYDESRTPPGELPPMPQRRPGASRRTAPISPRCTTACATSPRHSGSR
jgi:hypothetical protein